jgi:hypothetical protein
MDALIKWISERLAERSSRRGFFSTMEKALLGAAVIVTGQGFFAQTAEAQTLKCCDPTSPICPTTTCSSGSSVQYTWACHTHEGGHYLCNDCCDNHSGAYICTYITSLR